MFAQLKRHLLHHVTQECQQQSETVNDRCRTECFFCFPLVLVQEHLIEHERLVLLS